MAEMRGTREERQREEEEFSRMMARMREAERIREQRLISVTDSLIAGDRSAETIEYILSEINAWKDILFKINSIRAQGLVSNILFFPRKIQETLISLLPILKLKTATFSDGGVKRSELIHLLSLAMNSFNTNLSFVTTLSKLVDKPGDELLNTQQTLCLQRIVDDYQIGLLGPSHLVNDIVAACLLATSTLNQLKPKKVKKMSFHDTMKKYYEDEYLPYAEIMSDSSEPVVPLADPIIQFIMARHKNNACLADPIYAPQGKFTLLGLKKYLLAAHGLVSQRECEEALRKTGKLRESLEIDCTSFWKRSSKTLKLTKITALKALETRIKTGAELPEVVATDIKQQYPVALQGYFSRTKTLLNELENVNSVQATQTI